MERGEPPPATHIPGRCCHQRTRPTPPPAPRARPPLGSELRLWSQTRVQGGPTLRGRDPALSDLFLHSGDVASKGLHQTLPEGPRLRADRRVQGHPRATTTPFLARRCSPPPRTQGHSRPLSPPPSSVAHGAPWAARPERGHQGGDECTAHLLQGSARLTLGAPLLLEAHSGGLSALAQGEASQVQICLQQLGPGLPMPFLRSPFIEHLLRADTVVTQPVQLVRGAAPGKVQPHL